MNFLSLIESKRDGKILTGAQLGEIVSSYAGGQIPDYQMAAFLMAVYFRGLNTAETTALTLAMRDSGDKLKFPKDSRPLVDKHSTGGVGDKVSLPLAPLLACLGFRVPMISGCGLGITGGTLDKLDSIPGFSTSLPAERIVEIVQSVGCVICGQTERMVPADKRMYALRDVTGTVPSIPLIVASILSKKLAEGLDALVLDVKFGSAAFMPTQEKARELAGAMVKLGNKCGVKTRALLTNMDTPLGRAAGNWLEVKEAVACLEPVGIAGRPDLGASRRKARRAEDNPPYPSSSLGDLREIVLACAAHLLVQTGRTKSLKAAHRQAKDWDEMLAAQGADLDAFESKLRLEFTSPIVTELKARKAGYVSRCDARIIGEVVRDLGGGRVTKESVIDHDVGVDRLAKPGERVSAGSVLAQIHAMDKTQGDTARARLESAFVLQSSKPRLQPLID